MTTNYMSNIECTRCHTAIIVMTDKSCSCACAHGPSVRDMIRAQRAAHTTAQKAQLQSVDKYWQKTIKCQDNHKAMRSNRTIEFRASAEQR